MRLADLSVLEKNQLAAEYREHGMVVVPGMVLPRNFQPAMADFVFLARRDQCEVYIGANAVYLGPDQQWQERLAQPEGPGRTRLIGVARGDFFNGWKLAVAMLEQAGDDHAELPQEGDRPLLRDLVRRAAVSRR